MRKYTVPFLATVSAGTYELVEIIGTANFYAEIKHLIVKCGQNGTPPSSQFIYLKGYTLTGTISAGTGGSPTTLNKIDQGDSAANSTATQNNSGPAGESAGTKVQNYTDGFYVFGGIDKDLVAQGGEITLLGAQTWSLVVVNAPTGGNITVVGEVEIWEKG